MEKEQLIEEAVKSLREERRKLIDLIERAIKGDLTALVEAAALGQYSDFATNILTTLLTKHEDAVLEREDVRTARSTTVIGKSYQLTKF